MKKKWIKMLSAVCLTASLAIFCRAEASADTLTMTLERSTLGGDLLIEPTVVEFTPGENYAQVFTRELDKRGYTYSNGGTTAENFYLAGINGVDCGYHPPGCVQKILEDANEPVNEQNNSGGLFQMDYTSGSGWMYYVNDHYVMGMSTEKPAQNDVVRFIFTLYYGTDLTGEYWDPDHKTLLGTCYPVGDKTELIRLMGQVNQDPSRLQSESALRAAYDQALTTLKKMDASQSDVDSALGTLRQAAEAAPTPTPVITETPTPTPVITETPAPTPEITETPTPTPEITETPTPTPVITETPVPMPAEPIAAPLADVLRQTGDYISATDPDPDQNSQWNVIGLARSGLLPEAYRDRFYSNTAAYIREKDGVLSRVRYTEYSKMILSMTAIGRDARDVAGYDLLEKLADFKGVKWQGINGPIWALIALHAHPDYQIPLVSGVEEQTTEEGLIAHLLEKEIPGGGWSLMGTSAEVDITSMALQALAPYYKKDDREDVTAAIDRALAWLSQVQMDDGGFSTMGSPNAESTCQVLTALSALGIDCGQDSRFIKDGRWIVNALLSYRKDGGFMHIKEGTAGNGGAAAGQVNGMATEQAFYALTAYQRLLNGQTALYDMSDVDISPGQVVEPEPEEPVELKGSLKLKTSGAAVSSVQLRWSKITGAAGYRIYRYVPSAKRYKRIATLSPNKTSHICRDLSAGTTYRFRVAAYVNENGKAVDKRAENVAVSTRPTRPTVKAARKTAKKARISWSRVNGSSGYEIYMSTKKDSGYKKVKTVTSGKKGSYIKSGLKPDKTYHFRVRAYRKVNGKKIYGSFSAVRTVRGVRR